VLRRRAGAVTIILGGVAFEVGLSLLPYFGGGRGAFGRFLRDRSLWDLTSTPSLFTTRLPVILTVLGAAAIALAAASLLADAIWPLPLATCCCFYLFCQVFPVGAPSYSHLGAGFWLMSAAAVTMSLGGVLALTSFASRFAKPS
jgi:hypothetical protein